MGRFTSWVARGIWNVSEYSGIGLGWLAPHIFGAMVGSKAVKRK